MAEFVKATQGVSPLHQKKKGMYMNCTPLMDRYLTGCFVLLCVHSCTDIVSPSSSGPVATWNLPGFPGQLPLLTLLGSMLDIYTFFFFQKSIFHVIFKFIGSKLIFIFSSNYFTFLCNFNFVFFLHPNIHWSLLPFFMIRFAKGLSV